MRNKMCAKVEYVGTAHPYATQYVRSSKAMSVLWVIFSICYAIISVVAFITPEWVGDPDDKEFGCFGLWIVCQKDDYLENYQRKWHHIFTVPTLAFQLATFFMGVSVLLALLTISFLILLIFAKSSRVFCTCGWMQMTSAICMVIACGAFPFGWNSDDFRKICGPDANKFEMGLCNFRWAYPLAIIGCIDGIVLAILAFILATRHVKSKPAPYYANSPFKGEINNAYFTDSVSLAGSRKSLNLQPILLVANPRNIAHQDHDTISQFSSPTPNHRY